MHHTEWERLNVDEKLEQLRIENCAQEAIIVCLMRVVEGLGFTFADDEPADAGRGRRNDASSSRPRVVVGPSRCAGAKIAERGLRGRGQSPPGQGRVPELLPHRAATQCDLLGWSCS